MARFLLSRALWAAVVLTLVSVLVALLVHLMPGDAAQAILGDQATPEGVAAVQAELGLDRSLPAQYASWVAAAATGDFGASLVTGAPVVEAVISRLPVTLSLVVLSLTVSLLLGVAVGTAAALRAGSGVDRVTAVGTALGVSVPNFWLALMLALGFALTLKAFPATGYVPLEQSPAQWLNGLVLPVASLSLSPTAIIARQTRSAMVQVLATDYIRAARGRGIRLPALILRHALKNAFIPVVTTVGLIASVLFGGTVFVESVFALPGIGQLLIISVQSRDIPTIQGILVFIAASVLVVNLLVDLSYGLLNPKARVS